MGSVASITLREALASALERLNTAHISSARLNAEILLMFALSCDRSYLYAHPEHVLTTEEFERFEHAVSARTRGVPAQYITGHQEFWGMDFIVTPDVLIPRPETEHLIEAVLPLAGDMTRLSIADVGTGTGCIAIALAKELPAAQITAVDISSKALDVARINAERHHLGQRIDFKQSDLLDGMKDGSLDFVVSNPPYVGEMEEDQVQLEVLKFEPRTAVFAGPTGLEVIQRLVPQAYAALKQGGWIVMEISRTIADSVKNYFGEWKDFEIRCDLQKIPRVAMARKG